MWQNLKLLFDPTRLNENFNTDYALLTYILLLSTISVVLFLNPTIGHYHYIHGCFQCTMPTAQRPQARRQTPAV